MAMSAATSRCEQSSTSSSEKQPSLSQSRNYRLPSQTPAAPTAQNPSPTDTPNPVIQYLYSGRLSMRVFMKRVPSGEPEYFPLICGRHRLTRRPEMMSLGPLPYLPVLRPLTPPLTFPETLCFKSRFRYPERNPLSSSRFARGTLAKLSESLFNACL